MIATRRGLAIAVGVAVLLAIALGIDLGRGRTGGAPDRSLVPGLDPDRVTELIWDRAGQPPLRVTRAGGGWTLQEAATGDSPAIPGGRSRGGGSGVGVAADAATIGEVLAALRGGRWHRRGDPAPVQATLTVIAGAERHVLGLGAPVDRLPGSPPGSPPSSPPGLPPSSPPGLPPGEQVWLTADGRGVLVDSWIARALDRDRLALRIKAPLAEVRRAQTIAIGPPGGPPVLRLAGWPRRLLAPSSLVIAASLADELERALAELTIVQLPASHGAAADLVITATDAAPEGEGNGDRASGARAREIAVAIGGPCAGDAARVEVTGSAGDGCVEASAADAVRRAIAALRQPPAAILEPRPVPFEPARVVLADGAAVDVIHARIGDAAAEPARIAELLAALAAPAAPVALPAAPAAQHLVVTGRDGAALTLELFADQLVARSGEPLALRPPPGAWRLLTRPSRELRDPALWLEEPTTITAIQIDAIRYQRGAVIGTWTRAPVSDLPGSSAPAPGSSAPAPGSSAPAPGSSAPAPGNPATAPGSSAPDAVTRPGAGAATSPAAGAATSPAAKPVAQPAAIEALATALAAPRALGFSDEPVTAAHRVTLVVTPPTGAATAHVLVLGAPRTTGCPATLDRDTVILPSVLCAQVAALAR